MTAYLTRTFGLSGRRALVTGAGRGIGRAIAEAIAGAGAAVLLHYHRSGEAAEAVAKAIRGSGGDAATIRADLAEPAAIDDLLQQVHDRWAGLDILVNNAGDMMGRWPLALTDEATLTRMLDVNLLSTIRVTRAALPLLGRGFSPVVINLTSVAAHNGGAGGVSVYAAAKGGVLTLTRSLAKELGPAIRVNAIAPGVILTDLHKAHSTDERLGGIAKQTPLGRNGLAEECAGAAVFLASAAASFITGECLEINGGLWVT